MSGLPPAAQIVWLLVISVSSFVVLTTLQRAPSQPIDWVAVALFAFVGTIAQSCRIHLPSSRERQGESTSVAMAISVAASMVLPVAGAIMVVPVGWIVGSLFRRRSAWYKGLFNVGQNVLAVAAAGTIWHTFGGENGAIDSVANAGWMLVSVGAYFAINTGSVAMIVALVERLPLPYVWIRGHKRLLPSYFAVMSAGVLGAHLWSTVPLSVVLLIIPLVAIYYSFKRTVELEEQTVAALFDLADMMDQRDPYTHGHSLRVGDYAERLAIHVGLSADEASLLFLGGRLHDIGKCAVDNEVLLKPGPLDDDEYRHIMRHAEVGGDMLANFTLLKVVSSYVRGHHERWDGTGYPDRLRGEAIPLGARLIGVVDAYDAMTSTRPYRKALPHDEAARRLREGAGSQWEARLVEAFLHMSERRPADAVRADDAPVHRDDERSVPATKSLTG